MIYGFGFDAPQTIIFIDLGKFQAPIFSPGYLLAAPLLSSCSVVSQIAFLVPCSSSTSACSRTVAVAAGVQSSGERMHLDRLDGAVRPRSASVAAHDSLLTSAYFTNQGFICLFILMAFYWKRATRTPPGLPKDERASSPVEAEKRNNENK